MLGPTLAPEQQEALMHILVALQQSGEALPAQDLDTLQVRTTVPLIDTGVGVAAQPMIAA